MARKKLPMGIKIISTLYYVFAVLSVILGVILLIASGFRFTSILGIGLGIFFGILLIGVGVFEFFIGRGLWKGQKWAWIVAIVGSGLGVIGSLLPAVRGNIANVLVLVISLVIGGYLLLSKEAKSFFSS